MRKKRDKEEEEEKKGTMSCCEREGMRRGAWTAEEDKILVDYIREHGHGTWRNLPKLAAKGVGIIIQTCLGSKGLLRHGKSCRLRWTNYLRPDIRRGPFCPEEEKTIIQLQGMLGNRWAAIASKLPGRTDNDVKNFWNSHLRKRFSCKGLNQQSPSSKSADMNSGCPLTRHMVQWETVRLEAESRLSTKPSPLDAATGGRCEGDYFLCLWNSEVGESFRHINGSTNECGEALSHSPTSQTSSLTKLESCSRSANRPCRAPGSPETAYQKVEVWNCKKEAEDMAAYSESSKSYEMDNSSDAMLQLLLDFPMDDDNMGFLQEPIDDVSTYIHC